jgi:NDP-sugar pyrophosphorylase family protein
MQAMLLAAGLGTRLWPLTQDRAKPAVPFLGTPLVAHAVRLCASFGIKRVVVNTHHLPESIHRALEEVDGTRAKIDFSHEETILGTGGAIARARERGLIDRSEPLLVFNAKLYTDLDFARAIRAHEASGALVTMVLRPNLEREAFREVKVAGGRVIGFGEGRVPAGPDPLLFTGIHVLAPEVVAGIPHESCDTVADIYPPLIREGKVAAHVDGTGRWWELSTLERYVDLHVRAHEEGIGPDVCCSKGASIDPRAHVTRSVLWEDARVEAGAQVVGSVIGSGVVVPTGAVVERSVLVQEALAGDDPRGVRAFGDVRRVAMGEH